MELKKSKNANLESKKNTFFLLGLVFALGMVLVAFEWKSRPTKVESLGNLDSVEVEDQFIPVTREKEIQPPPPPPPPKVVEVLHIVDDNSIIEDEPIIEASDADNETFINAVPIITSVREEEEEQPDIFTIVEDPAMFPGGDRALYQFISKNVRYPVIAQENGIQGKVFVKFVVSETGDVSNAEILRGVDPSLNQEALRVINNLPRFKPGKQRGKPVKVFYNAVINFTLQ